MLPAATSLPVASRLLYATTIFLSAFLLFSIESLTAKRILPWFGGSSAVWATCLVFYQSALLLGYGYAASMARRLSPRAISTTHIGLLLLSLLLLPIGPARHGQPPIDSDPSLLILGILSASIGLPFLALSATTPLLQHWAARTGYATPYRLFALSNIASLLALLSYPFLIEPALDTTAQARIWSFLYALFALACIAVAWTARQARTTQPAASSERIFILPDRVLAWFALSTCGSMLLLSVTNHLDENVAPVPLLWVVPLALYLLTFILSFGATRTFQRGVWLRLLAFALGVLGYSIYNINAVEALQVSVPLLLAGLFVCCMFCHGELNRLRPAPENLTFFYLIIAGGGAAGAILIGLVAPHVLNATYDLPITLGVTALLATALTWHTGSWPLRMLWSGVSACMLAVLVANVSGYHENSIALNRSFYGALRVVQSPHAGPEQTRTLFHGSVEHGSQFRLLPNRLRPTTYYGPGSGVGILLREGFASSKHVAVVGLGAGTVAAYGQPGDVFRFYELNDQVITIARNLFSYLSESKASVQVAPGDARLSLAAERDQPRYDVLVLDAFSGDAIPVHLLTAEAMSLYWRRLKPEGVIAVNVSNNFLDLAPVVERLAQQSGRAAVLVRSHQLLEDGLLAADWVLVTRDHTILTNPSVRAHSFPISQRPGLPLWTDTNNSLLELLKTPEIR